MFQAEVKSKVGEDISILIRPDNHAWNYLCECGDASGLTVKEVQNTNAVFISHTHIDHFVNFDALIRHQIGIERRVVICGPMGIARQVQAKLKAYTWNLIQKGAIMYEIREVIAPGKVLCFELEPPEWELKAIDSLQGNTIFQEKTFSVSFAILDHKTPSLAFKFKENDTVKIDLGKSELPGGKWVKELKEAFEEGQKKRIIEIGNQSYCAKDLFHLLHVQTGDSLGIIMDHAAHEENHQKILTHFSQSEKVFIESFYKADDQEQAQLNYHSYSRQSGKIMRRASVKQAIPVHFSRRYSEEDIRELIREFEEEFHQ
ncbi:peptidase [Rapidithrix thailandica]|uniref:Peptidase n=1 Tax=Rapidithrix thailandica TaxID=413964 RepID=A0AAW9SM32_9BACT